MSALPKGRLLDRTEQRLWTSSAIDRHSTFFQCFADLPRHLKMNIAITYLEVSNPTPRKSGSIINTRGGVVLNYSKVCIRDFAPDAESGGGCAVNCSPGDSFRVCAVRPQGRSRSVR